MAEILYPPYVEGTIPAFYGTTLVVPFSLNKANSNSSIKAMNLKMKQITTNNIVGSIITEDFNLKDGIATFHNLRWDGLIPGQFYKIQIAFVNNDSQTCHYSTTAVVKYTYQPTVYISSISDYPRVNSNIQSFVGIYNQIAKDVTEKMYSSYFEIYKGTDENNLILEYKTDTRVHDSSEDLINEAKEVFIPSKEFDLNTSYMIRFCVTTINGLISQSPYYKLEYSLSENISVNATIAAIGNFENGSIELYFDNFNSRLPSGDFLIYRYEKGDWFKIGDIHREPEVTTDRQVLFWNDYTVEQGVEYIYAIQKYDGNQCSKKIMSDLVRADFEDAFLYDGKKLFRLRYNTKVSSFKTNILEQKTNTIGNKYPYVFRNGKVRYNEFPISGLLTYIGDLTDTFITKEELGLSAPDSSFRTGTTATELEKERVKKDISISEQIAAERKFKLLVYNWLNDGEVKMFKSATEGNYIVRIMNVSLTPNDTVGRMLHTFSATAYEVADFVPEELEKYDLL